MGCPQHVLSPLQHTLQLRHVLWMLRVLHQLRGLEPGQPQRLGGLLGGGLSLWLCG